MPSENITVEIDHEKESECQIKIFGLFWVKNTAFTRHFWLPDKEGVYWARKEISHDFMIMGEDDPFLHIEMTEKRPRGDDFDIDNFLEFDDLSNEAVTNGTT